MRRVAWPLLGFALTAACRGERADPVAAAVRREVAAQLGVAVEAVRCVRDRCDVRLAGGVTLAVRVEGEREVTWTSDEVIRTAPVADHVRAELAALGVERTVDCGPALVVATAGAPTRITCTLSGGGAAWVDVATDGTLALELALDGAAVRARTEAVDPAGLDELSRALDTATAEGAGDEGGEGGADAGPGDEGPDPGRGALPSPP